MKKNQLKVHLCMYAILALFCFSSCSKNDLSTNSTPASSNTIKTRSGSEFHWFCPDCNFINGVWRNDCTNPRCEGEYEESHGEMLLSIVSISSHLIQLVSSAGLTDDNRGDPNRIELPGKLITLKAPDNWYDNAIALRLYEAGRTTSIDSPNKDFLEAYDFAWFRTTRVIYSNGHTPATINREYTIFNNRAGTNLKRTAKGRGILAGTKAAVDAFNAIY